MVSNWPKPPTAKAKARKSKPARGGAAGAAKTLRVSEQLALALAMLEKRSTQRDRDNLARFGITAHQPLGVSMAAIQAVAKHLGPSHELAEALWETGRYEARLLAAFVAEADRVTPEQMERWCRDFDNWGVCDTLCFKLFDRTPHAWGKVREWADAPEEFVKRSAYALLASLSLHDKAAGDEAFLASLPLVERAASDPRNFVKKGVSWALRSIGRRTPALGAAATALAQRLSVAPEPAARWVGKDALREFTRLAKRAKPATPRKAAQGTKPPDAA
jgi:3-methyladenine DNA glycosylase AlkD